MDIEKGIAWVELTQDGKTERVDFTVDNDWVDEKVFEVLAGRLAAIGSQRQLAFYGLGRTSRSSAKRLRNFDDIKRTTGLRSNHDASKELASTTMPTQVLMPALSPTMEEGKLAKWTKSEGDEVRAGDVIAEIETDKATMEVEAVDEGRLGKILVRPGPRA